MPLSIYHRPELRQVKNLNEKVVFVALYYILLYFAKSRTQKLSFVNLTFSLYLFSGENE